MKVSGLILSVCLLLLAEQAAADDHKEKIGDATFECREDWSIYNANCYKAYNITMKYTDAALTCLGEGGLIYYPENEIEYHEFVAELLPETIWFGMVRDNDDGKWKIGEGEVLLENIPRWGLRQPNLEIGNYTAVDPTKEVMIYDGDDLLPFVCKHRACMEGYIPCDTASKCIPKDQMCDELSDCIDETDENNCPDLGTWYIKVKENEESGSFETGAVSAYTEKTWIIHAPVGKRIRLYVPGMNLQNNVVFVEVWSGAATFEYSEMLHRFTGNSAFMYLYSSTHFLTVRLYAMDVTTFIASYSLSWSIDIAQIPGSVTEETAITTWKSIPMPFTSEEIKPKNLMLWWHIDALEGQLITFYMKIDPHTGYTADEVESDIMVYGMEEPLKYRHYYTWSSNQMYLVSNFVPKNGAVTLRYKLGCGMSIAETYGIIVSPHPIPNDLKCSWTLNAGQSMSRGMVLKFYSLDLAEDTRTSPGKRSEDKFMIYPDGSETAITDVALYDDNVNNVIHAPGGHFMIDFESDAAFMSKGFTVGFGTDCENLDVSAETIKSTNMTYFLENVELSCPTGYKFHMEKYFKDEIVTLRCNSIWEIDDEDPGAIPECQVVYCGPPTKIQNGGVKSVTGTTYSRTATYYCKDGFGMVGEENATCAEDGTWMNVPICTSSTCLALPPNMLQSGSFAVIRGNAFTDGKAAFGTVVEFTCNEGYENVGATISHCAKDGVGWTHENNPPSCQRTACAVPPIANSDVPLVSPALTVLTGSTYDVRCNGGFSARTVTLFCQTNQTFNTIPVCNDTDECGTNTDACDDASTTCMNTMGSYTCDCKPGYERRDRFSCTDIRECAVDRGGCSTRCVDDPAGSYTCQCDPGYQLFEFNGFNGFNLPQGETGLRRNDRYHVNHTCVPVQCPTLTAVADGMHLTNSLSNYHYLDTVTLQCDDGYRVNRTGSTITSFVSTCGSDGTWDELYSCEARECSLPPTPTYGVYDMSRVMFGETVTLTCNLTSSRKKELKAVCIYDNSNVRFAGEDITKCPEIDCGDPQSVMPVGGKFLNNIQPATTTFLPPTSKFVFDCNPGFDVTGISNDDEGNTTVRCKENGRWNLGTLACTGKMCTDPGTPGDSKQIVTGYEIGSVLYYTCNEPGFTITGPKNYTCEFVGNEAVWSDSLGRNTLPKCIDTKKPTINGSCGQMYNVDVVDPVKFTPGAPSDNFAVASFSMNDYLQSGDMLLADTTVIYTARDFEGNEETCTIAFNVIDRSDKPTVFCPQSKTIQVSARESEAYNTSSEITVTGGTLKEISPVSIDVSVSKIGTRVIVAATAVNEYGTESSCTFMVDFAANACFQEELFVDNNAVKVCNEVNGNLVCESTCKSGYKFLDKTSAKNFTCSGTGSWDYINIVPRERFCLLEENPVYKVTLDFVHAYTSVTGNCVREYNATLYRDLGDFENAISDLCNQAWKVTIQSANKGTFFLEFETTVELQSASASVTQSAECIDKIRDNPNVFNVDNNNLFCGTDGTLTVKPDSVVPGNGALSCASKSFSLVDDTCLSYGPAQFFNEETSAVNDCPDGQYQDGLAQTSCKNCSSGQYPNGDKTACQDTCPRGFRSDSGFYPCTPCAVNTYWTAKDTCPPCSGATSTVGIEGATDVTQCYEPCPVGTYSRTGYNINGCTPCPMNLYQDETTQMTCKACGNNQRTSASGSISPNNCTTVQDVCNRTTCSENGECSFYRGFPFCACDTGYYGVKCQNMYHICDGNPCTNGATCNRNGTGYFCTCRTDLDICEMEVVDEGKTGSQRSSDIVRTIETGSLQGCKDACLNEDKCLDASYILDGYCVLYNTTQPANDLIIETRPADKHMRKSCIIAFGGDHCELDTKDNCKTAGCDENSRCMDKIDDFQCICPSAGGYTGELCSVANNPCSPNPCVQGTCQAFGSVRYECTCRDGYEGFNCATNIEECVMYPDACAYGGKCNDQIDDYSCSCSSGFSGRNCENTPDFCSNHDCSGENVCYNSLNRMEGVCMCDTNLFEPRFRCAMDVVPNQSAAEQNENTVTSPVFLNTEKECQDLCQDNLDCIIATFTETTENRFICAQYNSSYQGQPDNTSVAIFKNCNNRPTEAYACDQVRLPCENVDCNNGECQNVNNNLGSICICNQGYYGFRCQHSVDDCIGHQCQNGAECIDDHLTYNCSCKPGFDGDRCERNIPDCPGSCNTTNGVCEDRVDGYQCKCDDGYAGSDCDVEINECTGNPCRNGGTCTDEVNGFSCECTDGWQGDMCEKKINNCIGRSPCLNGGECISLEESAFCRCEGGATGEFCGNATLLCDTLSNVDVCINEGICVNGEGTATCFCPVVDDVQRCFMDDEITGKSGGNPDNPSIEFASGTDLDAEFCRNTCLFNEKCHSVSFRFVGDIKFCIYYAVGEETLTDNENTVHYRKFCPTDFEGKACEIVKDWCAEDPCKNNGTCKPVDPVGYKCECMPGYSGPVCEKVADPCDSNPCRGLAACQSTPEEYICQCSGGSVWTGTSCKTTGTNYTMLVNAAMGQAPPMLQTTFRLNATELSVMMKVRIHLVNRDIVLGTMFALLATPELELPDGIVFDFALTISVHGIYVTYGLDPPLGIPFNNDFGGFLTNGEWHHVGVSINSAGYMSATIGSLHVEEPVYTGRPLSLDYNGQISLGYGHIAQYLDVEVYKVALERQDFSNALVGKRPSAPPIQRFDNYNYPPSTKFSTKPFKADIIKNPNLELNCDALKDIYYASDDRLTSISSVNELVEMYAAVRSGSNLTFINTIDSTLTWGYYPVVFIGQDMETKNYGECRSNLYIRYNAVCPTMDQLFRESVESRVCSEAGGYCDVKCDTSQKILSAPLPYFITCGSLGVNDFRAPFAEMYYPGCMAHVPVNYRLDVSMQFTLDINCANVPDSTLGRMDEEIQENFVERIKPKWNNICVGDCTNLIDVQYECGSGKIVSVEFSLMLASMTLEAVGGGTVDSGDALKIIIKIENLMDLSIIAGALLIEDSVVISRSIVCQAGHRLDREGDAPVCVPCSDGYYLTNGECKPCTYGYYQDEDGKTECKKCEDDKTTYRRGVSDPLECKEICKAGFRYDLDEGKCVECRRHFYQHEEGKNFCIPCREEYKTAANASDSKNDCKEDCPAGEERNPETGQCDMCERGYWRSLTFDDCQKCPENRTTFMNAHAKTEADCEMDICKLGEYFDVMEKKCKQCNIGQYQDEMLKLSCKPCLGNRTTRDMGADNITKCEFFCPVGYERNGTAEVCLPCERGFFKDNIGDNKFGPCKQCPQDTTDMMGAISVDNCSLPVCGKGQYIDEGDCQPCAQDTYSDVEQPDSRTKCKSCGTLFGTLDVGSTSDKCERYCEPGKSLNGQTCDLCPRGYYKDNSGNTRFDSCTICPDKDGSEMTTDELGSDSQDACSVYKCAAGSISTDTGCKKCDMNFYQPKEYPFSTDTCLPCPTKGGLITNTRMTGTVSSEGCLPICDAGKYLLGTVCSPCLRGTYKANVGDARFGNCTDCPGGNTTETEGAESSTLCNIPKCPAGNYIENKECRPCALDTFSEMMNPTSEIKCISCGTSANGVVYGTENEGTDNSSLCKPTCPGGEQFDSTTMLCTDCPVESFKEDINRFGRCVLCETVNPGYVSKDVGANSSDLCDLRDCKPGEKIVGTACEPCPVKTYQDKPRQTTCIDCGVNLNTDGEGKTSPDDCQIECGPGLEGTTSCVLCPLGKFKPEAGYANCQDCGLDFTSNENRTDCDVVFCSVGKEYTVSGVTESCEECNEGFFKSQVGNTGKCIQCPDGVTTNGKGQGSCDLLHCVPGRYKLGTECVVCPIATYKGDAGNQECTPCDAGTTTDEVTGATSKTQCDTTICDLGSYRKPDQRDFCTPCEIGKYQPRSGQTTCEDCPNNEITLEDGQSSIDACVPECKEGQQYNSTSEECFLCPTGTFKASVGNTAECQDCPKDLTTAGQGGTSEASCSQNKCPPGKYYAVLNGKIECFDCPVGTFSDMEMQLTCTDCPNQNTTHIAGTDTETLCIDDCAAGFGYRTYLRLCLECPLGQYNDEEGLNPNTCKLCASGTTNTQGGLTSCTFPDEPLVDTRINLRVTITIRVALDQCNAPEPIELIKASFLQLMRNLFQRMTDERYNGLWRFCRGANCGNIGFESPTPICRQLGGRKREISHELILEMIFEDISKYITDVSDGSVNIEAEEIISQILTLYVEELSDTDLEIAYVGFANIATTELCAVGKELVNDTCTPCPTGKYGSSNGVCTQCGVNTYQNMTGQTECRLCPDKSFTETAGSTAVSQCIPICQAGNEFNSATKTCSECNIGFFKEDEGNDQGCTHCTSGRTTKFKGSTSPNDCDETLCVAGEFFNTSTVTGEVQCFPCPIGTYNPSVMVATCQGCGSDKTTLSAGKKSVDDCKKLCAPGTGYSTIREVCFNCKKRLFNDGREPRPNECKYCPDGKTTLLAGESSCIDEVAPIPRKRTNIVVPLTYNIGIDNCGSTDTLNGILTRIAVIIQLLFIQQTTTIYSGQQSFCLDDCTNLFARYPDNNPLLSCNVLSLGRKKRALTHTVNVELEFKNVSESTMDNRNNAVLPTEEVINSIIKNNEDQITPEPDQIEFQSVGIPVVNVLCSPGEEPITNECVPCGTGRFGTSGESCELCPADMYQDEQGQTSCKNCPARTFSDVQGAKGSSVCKSWCVNNPTYCNNRGICSDTGRRTASCSCYDNFEGARCESKKEPTSNMPAILGGAIGGGGALLIIILVIVGVFMRCSRDSASNQGKKKYYDPEYVQNGAYEGTYDNFGYHGGQVRPVAPYPSIGYPALGYKPDQSFEEGTYGQPYKYRPSIDGEDTGRPNDDSRFIWTA